jgi:hypothetical protein
MHRRCHQPAAQSSAPEDGRNYRPKRVELIEIIKKLLLLHLVGCLHYYIFVMSVADRFELDGVTIPEDQNATHDKLQ